MASTMKISSSIKTSLMAEEAPLLTPPVTPDAPLQVMASTPCDPSPVPVPKDLDDLVRLLHIELGTNGLACAGVDVERVKTLMSNYISNKTDWEKYALFDKSRYTRNLVDDGNGKFNLMILAWPETTGSAIHDHSGSHCLMKILDGELQETQYHWPEKIVNESENIDSGMGSDNSDDEDHSGPMTVKRKTILRRDEVAYMSDNIGLHRVANPLKTAGSLSLHLYTPPYEYCKTFDERSSKARSSGKCVFYSAKGQKLESCPSAAYLKCSLTDDSK
ncbi:Cysteine dioxygenase [Podila humilis]|nr:Cysteine dioxygenase [Podila humilis]